MNFPAIVDNGWLLRQSRLCFLPAPILLYAWLEKGKQDNSCWGGKWVETGGLTETGCGEGWSISHLGFRRSVDPFVGRTLHAREIERRDDEPDMTERLGEVAQHLAG